MSPVRPRDTVQETGIVAISVSRLLQSKEQFLVQSNNVVGSYKVSFLRENSFRKMLSETYSQRNAAVLEITPKMRRPLLIWMVLSLLQRTGKSLKPVHGT